MNRNAFAIKIAVPYARALYDFSVEQNLMHQITADLQNLEIFFQQTPNLIEYLSNPIISNENKSNILNKILKNELNIETLKFLNVLINRNRINLLPTIITSYLNLVYKTASIISVEVTTAFAFTNLQKNILVKKLKEITNAREIKLIITINPTLIGGFLIKNNSKIIDFSIKNQLQQFAKYLDTVLEI